MYMHVQVSIKCICTVYVHVYPAMLTSQLVLQGGGGGGGGDAEPLLSCEDTTTQTELPETPHQLSQCVGNCTCHVTYSVH